MNYIYIEFNINQILFLMQYFVIYKSYLYLYDRMVFIKKVTVFNKLDGDLWTPCSYFLIILIDIKKSTTAILQSVYQLVISIFPEFQSI